MKKLRIGIIGAGAIVEDNHLPAIQSLDQAEPAWIFDKNPNRAALLARMYGLPSLPEAPTEKTLENIDVCLLAIPYGVRRPYIDCCRNAGKAIVIEKPFAFSREEHTSHCQGFQPWQIAVNFQRRFYRSVAVLTELTRQRLFGGLRSIRFIQGNYTLKGGSGYLSDVRLSGGGVIAESSSHILDIIVQLSGAREVTVTQLRSLSRAGLDYDTVFDSEVRTPEGDLPVHCEITTLRNLPNGLYLDFDQAMVSHDLSPNGKIFVRNRETGAPAYSLAGESIRPGLSAARVNAAFLVFWQQFVEGVVKREANLTSAYSSLTTTEWIEAIYAKINHP